MLTALRSGNKVVADGSLPRVELKECSAAKELFCPVCGGLVKYCAIFQSLVANRLSG